VLERVKAALRERRLLTPTLEGYIAEFERLCICPIRSNELRAVVLDYLEHTAPLEFFTAPASSSGKNHPYWQVAAGGILLNTTECCIGIGRKMRMHPALTDESFNPRPVEHDVIYAATILSDTFKPEDAGKSWREFSHHRTAEARWREVARKHGLPAALTDSVAEALYWHLGRFTPEWPQGTEPSAKLSLTALITHELDMDFSNRALGDVFERKGVPKMDDASSNMEDFLQKEFDTTAGYFQHVETKLLDVVRFYTAIVLAVLTGIYYIAVSEMFKRAFWIIRTPRAFFIMLTSLVLFVIGLFFLGMYTELRVRKIKMLEEMAAIRGHYAEKATKAGIDLSERVKMVTTIVKSPPFLRRPSEDWYTMILMSFINAVAVSTACSFLVFVVAPNWVKNNAWAQWAEVVIWVGVGIVIFLRQFRWVTVFCYVEDCARELKHGRSQYGLMLKHSSSFPLFLGALDKIASGFEVRNKGSIIAALKERGAPTAAESEPPRSS
jgi:hypothetical protein